MQGAVRKGNVHAQKEIVLHWSVRVQATELVPVTQVPGEVVPVQDRVGAPENPVLHVPATLVLPTFACDQVALFALKAAHAISAHDPRMILIQGQRDSMVSLDICGPL